MLPPRQNVSTYRSVINGPPRCAEMPQLSLLNTSPFQVVRYPEVDELEDGVLVQFC